VIEAWGTDDVRAAEAALMAELPDGELMARAAEGLAQVALARLTERGGSAVVALVGPGNNGGDTLYAAAHLADRGFAVAAVRADWPVHEGGLARAQASGVIVTEPGGRQWKQLLAEADLVLDGILGIGGRPGLPEQAIAWVEAIPDDAYVLAVDLPSGQDPAGEKATPDAVFADETVTFGVPKPVHLLPATEPAVGRLTVVDIGLVVDRAPTVQRVTRDDVPRLWPVPSAGDDKYSRGVLGIVAGGEQYTGAALLCTTAAVCSGVGMVRYVGTATPTALVRSGVPEAVIGTGQVQAWVVGPGLDVAATGHGARQLEAARAALASDLPVLVDAGGLDLVERPRQARPCSSRGPRRWSSPPPTAACRCARRTTPRPGWPPQGPGTCWLGSPGPSSPLVWPPSTRGAWRPWCTAWRPMRPTRAARCARSRWPTAYRALWRGC